MTGANLNSQTQQFDPQDILPLTKDCKWWINWI